MGNWLVMQTADGRERAFALRKAKTVIGREPVCDVRVAMPAVSERHCEITLENGSLHLTDLDSEKGTYHNGTLIRQAPLADADTLTVGPVTFLVRINADEQSADGTLPEISIVRLETDGSAFSERAGMMADDAPLAAGD